MVRTNTSSDGVEKDPHYTHLYVLISAPSKPIKEVKNMNKKTKGKKEEAIVEYAGEQKEIKKLKACIKDKDIRLKKQEDKISQQAGRISTIEARHSNVVWTLIISGVIFLIGVLTYVMIHIYNKLPDSVITTGYIHDIVDALQFFGFYMVCFLAVSGLIAWIFVAHAIYKEETT